MSLPPPNSISGVFTIILPSGLPGAFAIAASRFAVLRLSSLAAAPFASSSKYSRLFELTGSKMTVTSVRETPSLSLAPNSISSAVIEPDRK